MTNLSFSTTSYLLFFLYIYIEMFYTLILVTFFKQSKWYSVLFSKKKNYVLFKSKFLSYTILLSCFYLITQKVGYMSSNFLSLILFYALINYFFKNYQNDVVVFINFNVIFFSFFVTNINNLVIFFLFVELYSTVFYFFFLNIRLNKQSIKTLQLKNSLLLYLINNFFTTIFFLIGIFYVIEIFGTVNFSEINYINSPQNNIQIYILVLAFLLKLALPGLHYLKLEIYKYLEIDNVILFSTITTYVNFMLTVYMFNNNFIIFTLFAFKYLNLLIVLGTLFIIQKLKVSSFQEFISYSGFATNNLMLLNLLLKNKKLKYNNYP